MEEVQEEIRRLAEFAAAWDYGHVAVYSGLEDVDVLAGRLTSVHQTAGRAHWENGPGRWGRVLDGPLLDVYNARGAVGERVQRMMGVFVKRVEAEMETLEGVAENLVAGCRVLVHDMLEPMVGDPDLGPYACDLQEELEEMAEQYLVALARKKWIVSHHMRGRVGVGEDGGGGGEDGGEDGDGVGGETLAEMWAQANGSSVIDPTLVTRVLRLALIDVVEDDE